ncbi:MAG: hypothetical protein NVS4B7_08870 [Ktedonobacteraceae bacterium]
MATTNGKKLDEPNGNGNEDEAEEVTNLLSMDTEGEGIEEAEGIEAENGVEE